MFQSQRNRNRNGEMKEGSGGGKRSEREKTKMRERQRRAITTNIFHGLRKHGGYRLSRRADINEVLRELAKEAGWVIEPDGTTYRSKVLNSCPLCGAAKKSTNPTFTSSAVIGGEGKCPTTALPHGRVCVGDPASDSINGGSSSLLCSEEGFNGCHQPIYVPLYTCREVTVEAPSRGNAECSAMAMAMAMRNGERQGEALRLEGANMPNQSTVVGPSALPLYRF